MGLDIIRSSGLNARLQWEGKERCLHLNLPDIKNKEIAREFHNHPTVKAVVQLALDVGIQRLQDKYKAIERLKERALQADTMAEYEVIVSEMDEIIEAKIKEIGAMESEISHLKNLLQHSQQQIKYLEQHNQIFSKE